MESLGHRNCEAWIYGKELRLFLNQFLPATEYTPAWCCDIVLFCSELARAPSLFANGILRRLRASLRWTSTDLGQSRVRELYHHRLSSPFAQMKGIEDEIYHLASPYLYTRIVLPTTVTCPIYCTLRLHSQQPSDTQRSKSREGLMPPGLDIPGSKIYVSGLSPGKRNRMCQSTSKPYLDQSTLHILQLIAHRLHRLPKPHQISLVHSNDGQKK